MSGNIPEVLSTIADAVGGKIESVSEFGATMSMPLPKDHWLYQETQDDPTSPFASAIFNMDTAEQVKQVLRHAIKSATCNGRIVDFDPDALVINLMNGLFGATKGTRLPQGAQE
jgi:ribosomal protein L22